MKRRMRQVLCLLLVCTVTAISPVTAGVARAEIEEAPPGEVDGEAPASSEETEKPEEAPAVSEYLEPLDNPSVPDPAVPSNGTGDTETEGEQEPEVPQAGAETPQTDAGASQEGQEAPNADASSPLNQEGEVTEPITKEDKPYLALGANLTQQQQATVLGLLGISPAELSEYDVIYITNEEEHEYLGNYVDAQKIGTRALSSVLIVKRDKGNGINITTKNISYCTIGMYKNALITAGITDADIIVAGPTPISGTAALVGAMKAYAVMTGEEVTEESMDTALNELVLTGDIADTVGDSEKAEELIAYLKQEVIGRDFESDAEIQEVIEDACDQFQIQLSDSEVQELISLLKKIGSLDLDLDSIKNQAEALYKKLSNLDIDAGGIWEKVKGFFQGIVDFFVGLFS